MAETLEKCIVQGFDSLGLVSADWQETCNKISKSELLQEKVGEVGRDCKRCLYSTEDRRGLYCNRISGILCCLEAVYSSATFLMR